MIQIERMFTGLSRSRTGTEKASVKKPEDQICPKQDSQ